jgi:hypothetical protein
MAAVSSSSIDGSRTWPRHSTLSTTISAPSPSFGSTASR